MHFEIIYDAKSKEIHKFVLKINYIDPNYSFTYGQYNLYFNDNLIVYTENEYNKELNEYIQHNYASISRRFQDEGKFFMYIPKLGCMLDRTSLSYLTGSEKNNFTFPQNTIDGLKLIMPERIISKIKYPSLSFLGHGFIDGFRLDIFDTPESAFDAYFYDLEKECEELSEIRFCAESFPTVDEKDLDNELDAEEIDLSDEDKELVAQARRNVHALISKGLSAELVYRLIKPQIKPSRLLITEDYKIFLPDYDNMEIKLRPIDKTIFFFYLRHPEGVNFKDLIDFKDELTKIYKKVNNRLYSITSSLTINYIIDPRNNGINEKCSHIRRVFLASLTVPLANLYYIVGKRGADKKILLDRNLVTWECEL